MISKPTVFVVGAGGSMPYGFPSGEGLVSEVLSLAVSEEAVQKIAVASLLVHEEVDDFFGALRRSGSTSIDSFLEGRPDYLEVGKASIAAALVPHERDDQLFQSGELRWYHYILNRMGSTVEKFRKSRLTIITFNYDRSLEHFLLTAVQNRFALGQPEAMQLLSEALNVIHMHGSLGSLPAFASPSVRSRKYGSSTAADEILVAAQSINVIHESDLDDYPQFAGAQRALTAASSGHVFFLGFGYHHVNMRRLKVSECLRNKSARGTSYFMESAEEQMAKASIAHTVVLDFDDVDILTFLRRRWVTEE